MLRRAAAKVQANFIDIAPSPPFRRIVAARPAEAQMHPRRTKFQTFFASERARRYVTDGSGVRTFVGH
jgi:hypothetical protein